MITVGINIINVILKLIIVKLVEFLAQDSKSAQLNSIKVFVFIAQFFNTGLLLLLSAANLKETNIPLIKSFFKGPYADFNSDWFRNVGPLIVQTMFIAAFMPIIEFLINYSMKTVFRLIDRRFTRDSFVSSKKSIQLYIDTYAGPDYMIHQRYSTILNTIFVCMLFGTALPLLFPISLLTLCVLYVSERL